MTPLKPDPCAITLRWTGGDPVPDVGNWLRSKRTAYLILQAKRAKSKHVVLRIKALRFAIEDISRRRRVVSVHMGSSREEEVGLTITRWTVGPFTHVRVCTFCGYHFCAFTRPHDGPCVCMHCIM